MRKLTLALASVAVAVSLVGVGAAAAADPPARTPLVDAVAARLGLTPDQLRAAFKATLVERVDQAVAAGRLTPEQAAKLKERIANAQGLGLGARGALVAKGKALGQRLVAKSKQLGRVAELLETSREELRAELKAGKSLAEIAAAKGVSRGDLVAAMVAPAKERLAKAVTAGKLTQARADALAKQLTERVSKLVDAKRTQTA